MSFIAPGDGARAMAGGNQITFKFGPDQAAEDLSLFESGIPAGGGVFPHMHEEYEEAFYVLEGEVSFLLGSDWRVGGPGTVVHVPKRCIHAFKSPGPSEARLLVMHTPARAVRMIEEMALLTRESPRTDVVAVLARHRSSVAAG